MHQWLVNLAIEAARNRHTCGRVESDCRQEDRGAVGQLRHMDAGSTVHPNRDARKCAVLVIRPRRGVTKQKREAIHVDVRLHVARRSTAIHLATSI
eukprot:scaffold11465_cov105-Isochrysis_galbana.AAC.2